MPDGLRRKPHQVLVSKLSAGTAGRRSLSATQGYARGEPLYARQAHMLVANSPNVRCVCELDDASQCPAWATTYHASTFERHSAEWEARI
jgi:hypothetical protein